MIVRDPTLEEIAAVLDKSKVRNDELRACCPAHGGEDPNLSLRYDDGTLLARCHSHHCDFEDIIAAIRERLGRAENSYERSYERTQITHKGQRIDERKPGRKDETVKNRRIWKLRDETGKLVALHVRDDLESGDKNVWWRLPSGKSGLGGRSTAELPLYGIEDYARVSGGWIVITEGEKAADALRSSRALKESGIGAVGTVTGASGTPNADMLVALRGRRVILWPDNDGPGHEHMGRIAESLKDIASEIRWFEWEDAPAKGDAADHPDVDSEEFGGLLKLAPRWSKAPAIEGLVTNMGDVIRRGVEPPEELLPDILLKSKAHNIYAPGGVGKTWVLVWLAKELLARGKKVVVFDLENGLRTYAERLEEVGADEDALNERFAYWAFPSLEPEGYARFLDEWEPDIVMFDSWIGFLAADGHDENVSNDISAWADAYSKPALRRGVAVLVLDHVPHEHERERGSSRKRDEMDVVWKLTKIGDFDRDQTATLSMTRQKDREGWLPEKLTFEIGGDPAEGFVMRRDDSLARRIEVTHLSSEERKVLNIARGFTQGVKAAEWQRLARTQNVSRASFYRLLSKLKTKGKVTLQDGVYVVFEPQDVVVSTGINKSHETSDTAPNLGGRGLVSEVSPPKGGGETSETFTPPDSPLEDEWLESPQDVPFTELSLEEKRRRFKENLERWKEERQRDNDG